MTFTTEPTTTYWLTRDELYGPGGSVAITDYIADTGNGPKVADRRHYARINGFFVEWNGEEYAAVMRSGEWSNERQDWDVAPIILRTSAIGTLVHLVLAHQRTTRTS